MNLSQPNCWRIFDSNGFKEAVSYTHLAEKLKLHRDTRYNRTNFFEDYTDMCSCELEQPLTDDSRIITSDDVFDFILNLRNINDGIDRKREELFEDYLETKYSSFRMNSLEDYEQLKKVNMTRSKTQSRYVRKQLMLSLIHISYCLCKICHISSPVNPHLR